jgi:hypothetical protein
MRFYAYAAMGFKGFLILVFLFAFLGYLVNAFYPFHLLSGLGLKVEAILSVAWLTVLIVGVTAHRLRKKDPG